jgi:hypothetical protein
MLKGRQNMAHSEADTIYAGAAAAFHYAPQTNDGSHR